MACIILRKWCVILVSLGVVACNIGVVEAENKQQANEPLPIERQIDALKQEKQSIQEKEQLKPLLQDISQRIDTVQQELQAAQEQTETFLNLKLAALTKWYQHVNELSQARSRLINIIDEHIQLLQAKKEGQTKTERQEQRVATAPGYETLREYAQKVYDTEQELSSLKNTKTNLAGERDRRKRALEDIKSEYNQKKKQQTAINRQGEAAAQGLDESLQDLSVNQQAEVIDLQLNQLKYKEESAQAKIKEDKLRIELIETKIAQTEENLARLTNEYKEITKNLHIPQKYINQEQDRLEEKRLEVREEQEKLNERLNTLRSKQEQLQSAIDQMVNKHNISNDALEAYREWSKQPTSAEEWQLLADLGSLIAEKRYVQAQSKRVEGQFDQEQLKLRRAELNYDILQTWYRLTQSQASQPLENVREIEQVVRNYENEKTQLEVELNSVQGNRNSAISMLGRLNASLDALKELKKTVNNPEKPIFDDQQTATSVTNKLQKAESDIRKQIDLTAKLVEIYSTNMATIEESIARIKDVVIELEKRSFWKRPEQSIRPQDLQNFLGNIERFLGDIRTNVLYGVTQIDVGYYIGVVTSTMKNPYQLLMLCLQIVVLILGYMMLRTYLPKMANSLVGNEWSFGFINICAGLLATIMRFIRRHLASLYIWFALLFMVAYGFVTSVQFAVAFYLASIPYGIYVTYMFFEYFLKVNRERGYIFIGQDYQSRFAWIVPSLVYATVTITLFRQAFLLSGYYDYQILLALNFILLQIALICLISREQVISLISGDTPMWNWVEEHVSRYYYVLLLALIAIIVMSNPFVGLGYQVLYFLVRSIITLLLIPVFSWLHDHIKRATSDLFFYYSEGEVVKERFPGGKSWYGLFVVASFFTFVLFGSIIAAYIWGRSITFDAVSQWFDTVLYVADYDAAGNPVKVTVYSLLKVLLFGIGGIFITYIINRFVLQRIFDPLLVGAGVQNTIVTLTRYAIVVLAFLFGFQSAGLEALGWKLMLLIFGIAYVMKEPLGDVISYFIILVQRPVKLGDFIRMDSNIVGVVRQINPRSTVIRYRNSTSFVVPNSHIITQTVQNWHYTRTFSAFEDILLTVPYDTDPDYVRDLIFQVLEENINVLRNPRPIVRLEGFVDNGFQFRVRGFITADKILDLYDIASNVRLAIVRKLRTEGIPIAVPTRVLKVTSQLSGGYTRSPESQPEETQGTKES